MRYSRNWEQNTMLEKGRVCMKDREELLKEIALMLERQDMLSKLTENQCLDEYGYSETHCIDYIGRLELPNVTKVAEHMGMTRGAISKMTKKLLAKGLIEKYTLETNKKEVYFKLTDQGRLLFDEHAKRHQRWEKRDMEFLARYSVEDVRTVSRFMTEFNGYLEEQIETITGTLSKLTENQCLDEYGYSETHCIDYIGRLELPNVTKVAEHMGMTRGAISKMTKKLLAKGLIEKYTLETNKKEVYFKLTDQGRLLFDEHAKRHQRWEKRDMEFLARYSVEDVRTVSRFMTEFNGYLEEQIETITGTQAEG